MAEELSLSRETERSEYTDVRATQVGVQAAFDAVLTLQTRKAPAVTFKSGLDHVGAQNVRFEPGVSVGP